MGTDIKTAAMGIGASIVVIFTVVAAWTEIATLPTATGPFSLGRILGIAVIALILIGLGIGIVPDGSLE